MYKTEAASTGRHRQVKECHAKGQPVLVGTVSIEKNEHLSYLLSREGIKHNLLNAKNHEKEAEIVAQAGKLGAVTSPPTWPAAVPTSCSAVTPSTWPRTTCARPGSPMS